VPAVSIQFVYLNILIKFRTLNSLMIIGYLILAITKIDLLSRIHDKLRVGYL